MLQRIIISTVIHGDWSKLNRNDIIFYQHQTKHVARATHEMEMYLF